MMSTSTHQQSLADVGSETRPPMLERGSYVPWSSRFMKYIERKRDTRKLLKRSIEKDIEAINLILLSIPNDIYNSVYACATAKDMWDKVKILTQGTDLSQTERESRFINEFEKFTSEPGESLTSVKYVTKVHLSKNLAKDHYDTLFDHLQQYEGIVNASRAKRATKSHDLIALVANAYASSSSSRSPTAYYVTHPFFVVDYDDDYQGDAIGDYQKDSLTTTMMFLARAIAQRYSTPTKNRLCTSSNTRNSRERRKEKSWGEDLKVEKYTEDARSTVGYRSRWKSMVAEWNRRDGGDKVSEEVNVRVKKEVEYTRSFKKTGYTDVQKDKDGSERVKLSREFEIKYFMKQMLLVKKDEAGVILSNEHNDFLLMDAFEIKELDDLSANICMMARIQQANNNSKDGPSYDSVFTSEVQNTSTSFMNPLYSQSDHEQTYHEQQEIIKPTIGNDQINSDIIFDDPNVEVNDGHVEHDKNAYDQQDNAMELLARNAYKEAEKQLILAKKVKQRNVELTKELEKYKEKKAVSVNPKLYDVSYLHSSNVRANVCDTEEIIEDATKSQVRKKEKLKDPIDIEKKVDFVPINYGKLNDLYETFVPQVKLSLE
ncbi:hypothetical protein Tco_1476293 [Tanacetum coccineum]